MEVDGSAGRINKPSEHEFLPVMDIPWDVQGVFRSRPNRFLALVDVMEATHESEDCQECKIVLPGEKVHVHDPGRLREILVPGSRVLLRKAPEGRKRKTKWDMIAGHCQGQWVLINSGLHRAISEEVLRSEIMSPFGKLKKIRAEVKVGHSRIDFLLTREDNSILWLEVKGCTLTVDGTALFPDAPTERGKRHLETLMDLYDPGAGVDAALLVLVLGPDARCFAPNSATDPGFVATFHEAVGKGVSVHPLVFGYDRKKLYYHGEIPVRSPG